MKFIRIEMLFLIWIVPMLLMVFIYGMKKRTKILSGFSCAHGLNAIVRDVSPRARRVKAGLLLGVVLFIILALTGPQYGYRWQKIERKGIDIILALDCSKSMLATDIQPTRLERAKHEIIDLLNMLEGDRIGLVAFAGTAFLQCPLTLDYEAFNLFLDNLTPDFFPVGGTDIHSAVTTAISGFNKNDNSEKAIILITDGESTGHDPLEAAKRAKDADVKVFCIGVGKPEGVPVPDLKGGFKKNQAGKIVLTRLEQETLKKIAAFTQGAYVRSVAGDMDLEEIYLNQIREKTKGTTLSSSRKQLWEDRYQWAALAGIIFLIIDMFLPAIKKRAILILLAGLILFHHTPVYAKSASGENRKGIEAYEKGDYSAALNHFIEAQLKDPDKPEIFYNIGNAYYKLNDFQSAEKSYEQAMKTDKPELRQKILYNIGNSKYRMNMLDQAISGYEDALKINPQDHDARQNLEFVKKKLEQQKKEQKQGDNKDSKKDEQKKQGQPQKKRKDSDDNKSSQKQSNKQENQDSQKQSQQPENKQASGAAKRQKPKQPDKSQAERILNRLKDMPGKGMAPEHNNSHVEKDW
jgi:Ca-activated chloride channel homolog